MSTSNESKEKGEIDASADMAQEDLDKETSDEEPDFIFDEKKQYYPLFYLTEIPADYGAELSSSTVDSGVSWVAISSNSPTNVIRDVKANIAVEEDAPMPFLNSTVDEVYEFFKNHLRPADDDPLGHWHTFTYFTFLVVDADCIKSEPWECILCCDAPDYGDPHPEPRLKQLRLPVARAMEGLNMLEDLFQTPSEFESRPDFVLGVMPPSWDIEVHNEQGERVGRTEIASPRRARAKKGHSVWKHEEEARLRRAERSATRRKL